MSNCDDNRTVSKHYKHKTGEHTICPHRKVKPDSPLTWQDETDNAKLKNSFACVNDKTVSYQHDITASVFSLKKKKQKYASY